MGKGQRMRLAVLVLVVLAVLVVVQSSRAQSDLQPAVFLPLVVSHGPGVGDFNPWGYIGHGNVYNCNAFANQAQAQAVLRIDPTDPNILDADRDGFACEALSCPCDRVRVPR